VHKYIKENGKRGKRKKRKRFSGLNRPGDFGPAERAGTRPRGHAAQLGPPAGAATAPWARAHMSARGDGDSPTGRNRSLVISVAVRRWWSGSGWSGMWLSTGRGRVLWWWGQFGRWTLGMAGPRRGSKFPLPGNRIWMSPRGGGVNRRIKKYHFKTLVLTLLKDQIVVE
jgi:hypothetical protein